MSEAASLPNLHLSGPDGDLQTQEPALLQLKGHSDKLPDILRGHVRRRFLLQRHLPRGYSGETVFFSRRRVPDRSPPCGAAPQQNLHHVKRSFWLLESGLCQLGSS